jgi:hypothetical protein
MSDESKPVVTKVDAACGMPAQEKKPYEKPTLRRLGSVRELTLSGMGGCITDNFFTMSMRHPSM